jgi:hypothetical protein
MLFLGLSFTASIGEFSGCSAIYRPRSHVRINTESQLDRLPMLVVVYDASDSVPTPNAPTNYDRFVTGCEAPQEFAIDDPDQARLDLLNVC